MKGPSVGYVDLLNYETTEYLKKEQAEGRSYQKTPIRPSAAGKCTRELYYDLMQYTGKAKYPTQLKEPEVHRLLNLGHTIESHIIRQFEQHLKMVQVKYKQQTLSFFEIKAEKNMVLNQWLEGSIDLCVWNEDWKCVIDIKSKKDKYSNHRKSQWDETTEKLQRMNSVASISDTTFWVEDLAAFLTELNDPFFEANFLQLNLYLNSDFLKERGVDHAAIIQYNKNDSRLREIRFKPCQATYDKVRLKFETAVKAVDLETLEHAPKDYNLGSMKCAFCDFKKECWNEDTLKAWFGTFAKKKWPTDLHKMGTAGDAIEKALGEYESLEAQTKHKKVLEEAILKLMVDNQLVKIRTGAGEIYEARHYKSPHPHFELKRSKI